MDKKELLEKNKSKILNIGFIFLILFFSFQIYKFGNLRINFLMEQKKAELKKNKVMEDITVFEKKINGYKEVFVKKDMSLVMDTIANIAKNSSVKIVSMKPVNEEIFADYIRSSFLISVHSFNYHALGDFISRIESHRDIYLVDEVEVAPAITNQAGNINPGLNIKIKISTIAYL